jgi:hypothetical protein
LRNDSKNSMMLVDPFLTELNEEEENSRVIEKYKFYEELESDEEEEEG